MGSFKEAFQERVSKGGKISIPRILTLIVEIGIDITAIYFVIMVIANLVAGHSFINAVSLVGVGLFFGFFFGFLINLIHLFTFIINKNGEKSRATEGDLKQKKYYSVDVNKYKGLLANIGMALSLVLILAAFEFKDFDKQELVDLGSLDVEVEEQIEIPPTEQKPPPPPKLQQPEIVEVPDEEEIEEEIEIELDVEIDEETVVEEVVFEEEPEEEEAVDEIFEIVEDSAEPEGGMAAFLGWVAKQIKYPTQARRMGVEGKVYVQFVVDKDGTLTDVKVVRGIGAGCDEEAIRVIEKSKKWKPGKQRGRAVRQRMILPINFKLG